MVEAGRIVSLWRYPVKSMAGERIAAAPVGELGLHARSHLGGCATSSTTAPPAPRSCPACCGAPPATPTPRSKTPARETLPRSIVGLPDGREFSSSDPRSTGRCRSSSTATSNCVRSQHYPIGTPTGHPMATKSDLRTIFGLADDEPLPDLSMFPVRKLAEITRYAHPGRQLCRCLPGAHPDHPESGRDGPRWRRTPTSTSAGSADHPRRGPHRPRITRNGTGAAVCCTAPARRPGPR